MADEIVGGLTQSQIEAAPDPTDPTNVGETQDYAPKPTVTSDYGASDLRKARMDLYSQQRKLMESLQEKAQPSSAETWGAIARGFSDPNAKWFSQGAAQAGANVADLQQQREAKNMQLAQMRMQLGQGMYAQQAQDVELRKQQAVQKLSESLVSPTGVIDKAVLQQMVGIDPKYATTVIESNQKIKNLLKPETKILKNDENLIQMGEDGNWKVVLGGVAKLDFATSLALQQLGIPIADINKLTPAQSNSLQAQIKANATSIDTDVNEAMTVLGYPLTRVNALTQPEREAINKHILAKKTAGAQRINVSVGQTGTNAVVKEVAEVEGKRIAKLYSDALGSPKLIDTADSIRKLLISGNVNTGPFAGIKLEADRLFGDEERVKASQVYLNTTAKNVLANIKPSDLGSGQGFTNSDLKFLEKATVGDITWDKKSLMYLADLQEMEARRKILNFNTEYRSMKESSPDLIKGMPTVRNVSEPPHYIPRYNDTVAKGKTLQENPYVLSTNPSLAEMQYKQLQPGDHYYDSKGNPRTKGVTK